MEVAVSREVWVCTLGTVGSPCDTKLNTLVRASSVSVGVAEVYPFNYDGCSQYEVVGFNRASLIWYIGSRDPIYQKVPG